MIFDFWCILRNLDLLIALGAGHSVACHVELGDGLHQPKKSYIFLHITVFMVSDLHDVHVETRIVKYVTPLRPKY